MIVQVVLLFLSISLSFPSYSQGNDSVKSSSYRTFSLPEISYGDLLSQNPLIVHEFINQLTTLGAVQITGIPKFQEVRKEALEGAGDCLSFEIGKEDSKLAKVMMPDGSMRLSDGSMTIGEKKTGKMNSPCGGKTDRLRALIGAVGREIFAALDTALPSSSSSSAPLMAPSYQSFSSLVSAGTRLDHLHAYFPSSDTNKEEEKEWTMGVHEDNGLFILMTSGHYSSSQVSSSSSPDISSDLHLLLPTGETVTLLLSDSSLILMAGQGAAEWLTPLLGKPFRAVPHALGLSWSSSTIKSRAWLGTMILPPPDAILPKENIPYSEYHRMEAQPEANRLLPLACGGVLEGQETLASSSTSSIAAYGRVLLTSSSCTTDGGEAGIYCWTQCMSIASLSCTSNQEPECVNLKTGEIVPDPKNTMCMDGSYPDKTYCVPQCVGDNYNSTSSGYCYGEGTSMSMTGFFSVAEDDDGSTPCLNFLFPEWTLDNKTKFAFACLGVLGMGILVQYLTVVRTRVKITDPNYRRLAKTFFFGIQIVLSYFLMLIAMTYSAELFSMVVIGLTFGYGFFHSQDPKRPAVGEKEVQQSDHTIEISPDPCCPEEPDEYAKLEAVN